MADALERRIAAATGTPKAKILREKIEKAVNAYLCYLEEATGFEVIISLGPEPKDRPPNVQWTAIKRGVH